MTDNNIYVTKPYVPPLEEFLPYLEELWQSRWFTNNGPFHQQLEQALKDYLGVSNLALCANGTLALVVALQALRVTGEVITTPFSFVATSHALLWNGIEPVFVDIDEGSFNLDPERIEAAITPRTTAILPVHVYGRPCNVDAIQNIADRYGLRVIYDAAHAFGVTVQENSILQYGDMSVLSFHATKIFSTFEGGAIICRDEATKQRIDYLKNFGFADEVTVIAPGINAKMNEFQAGLGLLQLKHLSACIENRKRIDLAYRVVLKDCSGIFVPPPIGTGWNYSYFPILVEDNYPLSRDDLYEALRHEGIFARRYFYPLLTSFPMYRGLKSAAVDNLPVANRLARKVLCLPIYPDLEEHDQQRVLSVIRRYA